MPKPSPEFTKGLANVLIGTKMLLDYGVATGQVDATQVRLTVMARQAKAKQLVDSGMSQRKTAKALGVSEKQVRRDLRPKAAKSADKGRASKSKSHPSSVHVTKNGQRDLHEEVVQFMTRVMGFIGDFHNELHEWHANLKGPLAEDDHGELVNCLHKASNELTLLAQLIDGR
jgi:predicted transcriptional regulator